MENKGKEGEIKKGLRESIRVHDLLVDFFELNQVPTGVAMEACLRILVSTCSASNASVEDFENLLTLAIGVYKKQKEGKHESGK